MLWIDFDGTIVDLSKFYMFYIEELGKQYNKPYRIYGEIFSTEKRVLLGEFASELSAKKTLSLYLDKLKNQRFD